MSKEEPLQGRVAKILNARELVINIGQEHGVMKGMIFAVLEESPLTIQDPSTGEVLGELDREKVRVKATEILPRMTVCKTYRQVGGSIDWRLFEQMGVNTRREPPIIETLKDDAKSYPEPLSPAQSFVSINDRVLLISDS